MCEDVNVKISGSSYSRKIYLSAEDVLQVLYNKQVLNLSTGKIKKSNFIFSCFYFLLTVHPNIMIVFLFTNLMHKFFILIHLLHSCTCFEHYYAHLQEGSCINTVSGIVTLFR